MRTAKWTLGDVPDMSGKTVLITGATSGVGYHTARALAKHGATVVLACRNPSKMSAVAAQIAAEAPTARLVQLQLDLADLDSVRAFHPAFQAEQIPRIDVLLLNAGVVADIKAFRASPQGFENTFATNYLGHWLLAGLLLEYYKDVPGARVVAVSSTYHSSVKDINYPVSKGDAKDRYKGPKAYAESKLALQFFVNALARRLQAAGSTALALPVHPGVVMTGIFEAMDMPWLRAIVKGTISTFFMSAEDGARALIMACTDPHAVADSSYGPTLFKESRGPPSHTAKRSKVVADVAKQDRLWAESEELCEFKYGF